MIKKNQSKKDGYEIFYAIGLITQIGVTVSIITVSFIGFGNWADVHFGTLPIFVLIGAALAFVFSMYAVYRLILPVSGRKNKNLEDR